jgi:hypothetical protein
VSERRSAIIVAFRLPTQIEAIRHRHVPVASLGVPPHVTILSPFMPAVDLDAGVRATIRDIAAGQPAFDVTFDRSAWFPDALYLVPDPASPFASLTLAVCRAFPAFPPYADPSFRPEDVRPHLTIAIGERPGLDRLVDAVTPSLPVGGRARALSVIVEGPDGRWRLRWRVPLRP